MVLAGMRVAPLSAGRMTVHFGLSPKSLSSTSRVVHCRATFRSFPRRRNPPLGTSTSTSSLSTSGTIRPFATSSVAKKSAAPPPSAAAAASSSRKFRWRVVARAAYYLRIPFLVLSVYGFGYQQGIADYSRDPEATEAELMATCLAGVGCTGRGKEEVLVASEGEWRTMLSDFFRSNRTTDIALPHAESRGEGVHGRMVMLGHAAGVGEKIVKVAQSYVKGKLMDAVREATDRLPPEVVEDRNRLHEALLELEDVDLWSKANKHMEGPWKFVLIPSPVPNAFVSEVLPRRIFVTTSFFREFIESEDELALVLGHEVSHLILGHSSERNRLETSLRTVEILLLSLDPTEGFLSLAFLSLLASVRGALGAAHSRENERRADELGVRLCAMACYDTRAASEVFRKMHLKNVESGGEISTTGGLASFFDSHPPSDERFRALLEESGKENREKYEETICRNAKTMFWDALKPRTEELGR